MSPGRAGRHRGLWILVATVVLLAAATIPYVIVRAVGDRERIDAWRPVDPIVALSSAHVDLPMLDGSPLAADDPRPLFVARVDGVYLGNEQVVPLPPTDVAAATGIDARYKRAVRDLYVVPLGDAAQFARAAQRRGADRGDDSGGDALLAVDVKVPQRVTTEIMYTLGQSEFGRILLVGRDSGGRFVLQPSPAPHAPASH